MKTIVYALLVVMCINTMLFLGQTASLRINPDANRFYDHTDSFMSKYDKGDYTVTDDLTGLPTAVDSVDTDSTLSSRFTDLFRTMKNWFLDVTGARYLVAFINAVPSFLKAIGLPGEIAFALGWIWHALAFFIAVMFIKGDS